MSEPTVPISWFDWDAIFGFTRRNLPHILQEDAVYFITFRLADSIPRQRLAQWRWQIRQWVEANPPPHTAHQRRMLKTMGIHRVERFLDQGAGACVLRQPACRDELLSLLHDCDGLRYHLGDFVLMPNHVHLLLRPIGRPRLGELLGPWRSISARKINKLLGRTGTLWQEECFDHIVRGPADLSRFRAYIRDNPARLPEGSFHLGHGTLFSDT